jgi:potassium-dependent mechanosensitive channel
VTQHTVRPWIAALALALACSAALPGRVARAQEAVAEAIPIAEISARASEDRDWLASLRTQVDELGNVAPLEGGIEAVRLDARKLKEVLPSQLSRSSGFDALLRIQGVWAELAQRVGGWQTELTQRAGSVEARLTELEARRVLWRNTFQSARDQDGPEVVLLEARATRDAFMDAIPEVTEVRDRLIKAQSQAAQLRTELEASLGLVTAKQDELLSTLLVRDQPPLWSLGESEDMAQVGERVRAELQSQIDATLRLATEQVERFGLQLLVLVVIALGLRSARSRTRQWPREDLRMLRVAYVFERPYAIALLLAIALTESIYVQPPHAVTQLADLLLLFPALVVIWPLAEQPLRPALLALGGFYLLDQLRDFVEALPVVERWLFILEMGLASAAAAWLLGRSRRGRPPVGAASAEARRLAPMVLRAAIGVFAIAACCAALGFMRLGRLLGDGTLGSAYAGVLLYAIVQSLRAVLFYALRSRFVRPVRSVSRHVEAVERGVGIVLGVAGTLVWATVALRLFGLSAPLYRTLAGVLGAELKLGSLVISLGDVLAFVLTIVGAMLLARAIERVLADDVYPRLGTARGASYAVSTILRYSILSLGFLTAVSAMGFDMDRLTVLIGAFGVGIGFGLQNVINNFVSGLILLFERPIQIGDAIEVDGVSGTVYRIGIRASVVRTFEGADVTIPNGNLLSQRLVNWTMSDRHRRIEITFSVPYGTDPDAVFDALGEAAAENAHILAEPAPQPLFTGFNEKLLDFSLRAWVADNDQWVRARSDLVRSVQRRLSKRGIEVQPATAAPAPAPADPAPGS